MNKRFSYITRAERVLGRRASIARRFFGTRRGRGRRRRSLETNSARLKKKKGKWGWPTARARARDRLVQTLIVSQRRLDITSTRCFSALFLVPLLSSAFPLLCLPSASSSYFLRSCSRFSVCFLTGTNGTLKLRMRDSRSGKRIASLFPNAQSLDVCREDQFVGTFELSVAELNVRSTAPCND